MPRPEPEQAGIRPIELPRLTAGQARLARLLALHRPTLTLAAADGPVRLRLGDAPGERHIDLAAPVWLSTEAGVCRLEPSKEILSAWVNPWIGDHALDALPATLREAARRAALAPLLDALEATVSIPFRPIDPPRDPSDTQPFSSATLELTIWRQNAGQESPIARLGLERSVGDWLAAELERRGIPKPSQESYLDVPLRLTPWLGHCPLTAAEWRMLELGDLMLIAHGVATDAIPLHLRQNGRSVAWAHLKDQRIIVERIIGESVVSSPMSDTQPDAQDLDSPAPLLDPDEFEIRVDFELGEVRIPLGEWRSIDAGYCFELTDLDRPRVRLIVADRLVGHGELVMIEDHLGVRVTDVADTPPSR